MVALLSVAFPLVGIVLELDLVRGIVASEVVWRQCAAVGAPSTCLERQMSPLVLARGFREAHVLLLWHVVPLWCRRGWVQMLMADPIDATVFGAHFGSGVARVPGCVCRVFRLSASCMSCGVLGVWRAVVRVFARFSFNKPSSAGLFDHSSS